MSQPNPFNNPAVLAFFIQPDIGWLYKEANIADGCGQRIKAALLRAKAQYIAQQGEKEMNYATGDAPWSIIGPVCQGTLRTEDLLTQFADELERLAGHSELVNTARRCAARITQTEATEASQRGGELVEELCDELQEQAPPYVYFGATEGDGACFGFWPNVHALMEDCRFGEVLQVNDTAEIPPDYSGLVCHVNERGNVTLYEQANGKLKELWGAV